MLRIDEIKKGLHCYDNKYPLNPPANKTEEFSQGHVKLMANSFEQRSPEHVRYLLSLLEIAEKALEKVKHNGGLDVSGEDAENILIVCGDIAEESLQQIRE